MKFLEHGVKFILKGSWLIILLNFNFIISVMDVNLNCRNRLEVLEEALVYPDAYFIGFL